MTLGGEGQLLALLKVEKLSWPRGLEHYIDAGSEAGKKLADIRRRFDNSKRYLRAGSCTQQDVNNIVLEARALMQEMGLSLDFNAKVAQVSVQTLKSVGKAQASNKASLQLAKALVQELHASDQHLSDAAAGASDLTNSLADTDSLVAVPNAA